MKQFVILSRNFYAVERKKAKKFCVRIFLCNASNFLSKGFLTDEIVVRKQKVKHFFGENTFIFSIFDKRFIFTAFVHMMPHLPEK